ncbi:MAG: cytochrome c oxidase subunit II [Anaerolineae bacterium]|nr:cytochrome c oxidase subunit II [Anaerolineae bacterium]NUQ06385.1 c-type cytochrome [Anaerolineae bacterium]
MGVNVNLNNRQPSGGQSLSIVWIIAGVLGIIFGGLLIGALTPALLPVQGSAESQQVDALFRFMLVIGGAIFLLVIGVLIYAVAAFRAKPGDRADGPPIHGNTTLELVWTIIPAIIVVILTIYSYQVWISIRTIQPLNHDVEVVGQRFAWTFNYDITPETLPADISAAQLDETVLASLNSDEGLQFSHPQLHTWVGEQVELKMRTEDVNHAFWIPDMRIKQDLLSGRETSITFTPIKAGVYRIVCAELCGAGHGNMAGTSAEIDGEVDLRGAWLVVHEDEQTYLREFYEPEAQKALFPPEDPVERGRQLLASGSYPCGTCHILTDLNWNGNIGPNLNNIGTRAASRVGGQTAEQYLQNSIRNPGAYLVPGFGNLMTQFNDESGEPNYMPEEDLSAIIAYLLTQTQ